MKKWRVAGEKPQQYVIARPKGPWQSSAQYTKTIARIEIASLRSQ
jgi:hypothetical protein